MTDHRILTQTDQLIRIAISVVFSVALAYWAVTSFLTEHVVRAAFWSLFTLAGVVMISEEIQGLILVRRGVTIRDVPNKQWVRVQSDDEDSGEDNGELVTDGGEVTDADPYFNIGAFESDPDPPYVVITPYLEPLEVTDNAEEALDVRAAKMEDWPGDWPIVVNEDELDQKRIEWVQDDSLVPEEFEHLVDPDKRPHPSVLTGEGLAWEQEQHMMARIGEGRFSEARTSSLEREKALWEEAKRRVEAGEDYNLAECPECSAPSTEWEVLDRTATDVAYRCESCGYERYVLTERKESENRRLMGAVETTSPRRFVDGDLVYVPGREESGEVVGWSDEYTMRVTWTGEGYEEYSPGVCDLHLRPTYVKQWDYARDTDRGDEPWR